MNALQMPLPPHTAEELMYEEYDFIPHKTEPLGRVSRLECNRGVFACKKAKAHHKQLHFIQHHLEQLEAQGYESIVPFYPNKYGDPFVTYQGNSYYVMPWLEDQVEYKYSNNWESTMLQAVGKLHRMTAQPIEIEGKKDALSSTQVLERWNTRLKQMGQYMEELQGRTEVTPLEASLIQHYPYLYALASKAIRYLREWNKKNSRRPSLRSVLCHGHIHRSNSIYYNQQLYILNFDYARMDTPTKDLALFFRRHLEKVLDGRVAKQWLASYEAEFPLLQEEKVLLAIYLLYPEKVFKEVEYYSQGIRQWTQVKHMRYLERQIKLTYKLRELIRDIVENEASSS